VAKTPTKDPLLRLINPVQESLNRMSYSEIARKSGTTFGFISLLFRGYRSAKVDTLERIAGALGVSITELHAYLKAVPKQSERHGWSKAKGRVCETA
jgi:transcriptional regulator with XRE-family HTH domain